MVDGFPNRPPPPNKPPPGVVDEGVGAVALAVGFGVPKNPVDGVEEVPLGKSVTSQKVCIIYSPEVALG